jgi:hypothetical protein
MPSPGSSPLLPSYQDHTTAPPAARRPPPVGTAAGVKMPAILLSPRLAEEQSWAAFQHVESGNAEAPLIVLPPPPRHKAATSRPPILSPSLVGGAQVKDERLKPLTDPIPSAPSFDLINW